jgi:hypothetical protein
MCCARCWHRARGHGRGRSSPRHAYDALLAAKRNGALDEILKTPLSQDVYGPLPDDVAETVDVPRAPNRLKQS